MCWLEDSVDMARMEILSGLVTLVNVLMMLPENIIPRFREDNNQIYPSQVVKNSVRSTHFRSLEIVFQSASVVRVMDKRSPAVELGLRGQGVEHYLRNLYLYSVSLSRNNWRNVLYDVHVLGFYRAT